MILTGIAAVTGECRFLVKSRLKGLPGLEATSPVAVQGFSAHSSVRFNREPNNDVCFGCGSRLTDLRSWIIPCSMRMLTVCL
jgi:hypothetical protein